MAADPDLRHHRADTSGTGNQATASGVTWTGSGAKLTGQTGQEITTRGPVVDTTGSFSVSAWVNLSAITGSDEAVLTQDAGSMSGFYLGIDGGSDSWGFARPEEDENDPPDWAIAGTSATAKTGTWTFLTGVFNVNTGAVQLYVNGTDSGGDATDPSPIAAHGPLEIGAEKWDGQAGTGNFDGSITNVEVYPTALSAAEVANLYGQGSGGGDIVRGGLTTNWQVDELGQMTAETDPDGVTTGYTYDEAGRLAITTGPSVATETGGGAPVIARAITSTGYDTFGDVAETQDPDGNVTTYAYDADGRQVSETRPPYTPPGASSAINGTSTTQYNSLGEVTAQTDPDGNTTQYSYDQLGDQTGQTDPDGGVTTTAYDADGEQLSQTGPTGAQTTATYDYLGRQVTSTVVDRYPSTAPYTTATSYTPTTADPSGTWPSSVTSPDGVVTSYGYDADGDLTSKTTAEFTGAGTNTYTYDQAGRLTSWNNGSTTTSYAYDADGNRVQAGSTTYTYDARDELTSDGTNTYSYSANGDLSSVSGPSGTVTSTSDAYGQQGSQGSQSDVYDALGRDVQLAVTGGTTTTLSYEGTTGQLTSDGTSDYTWTPDGTLTGTESAGTGVLDFTDAHSDVTGQFAATGTSLAASRTYGPWGTVTATGGTIQGTLGYQSQYTSPVTGQTDMGARWYNPTTGSFGNKDTTANKPVPNSASASPYGYAADNPLGVTDPSGHIAITNIDGTVVPLDQAQAIVDKTTPASAVTPVTPSAVTLPSTSALSPAAATSPAATPSTTQKSLGSFLGTNSLIGASVNPTTGESSALPGLSVCTEVFLVEVCPPTGISRPAGTGASPVTGLGLTQTPQTTPSESSGSTNDSAKQGSQLFLTVKGTGAEAQEQESLQVQPTIPLIPESLLPSPATPGGGGKHNPVQKLAQQAAQAVTPVVKTVIKTAVSVLAPTLPSCLSDPQFATCALAAINIVALGLGADEGAAADVCPGGLSFSADTQVLLADGKAVPISSLKPGDKILATNTSTGKTSPEAVAEVEINHDHDLYNLKLKTPDGIQVIHTTSNHLFWDPKAHKWVQAADLKSGESLKTPDGTSATADGGTTPATHDGWMWDLTIPGNNDHDFYVAAGDSAVLVHNCGPQEFPNLEPENMPIDEGDAIFFGVTPAAPGTAAFGRAIATAPNGVIKWSVTKGLGLRIMPSETADTIDLYHSVLSGGDPVLAAGEAQIVKWEGRYYGRYITYHSGHFQPEEESLDIGINAFRDAGIEFDETGSY